MALPLLQNCLLDWIRSSKLKLNQDKTGDLLFGTQLHRKEFMKHFPAKLLDHEILPTDSVGSCLTAAQILENITISLVCPFCDQSNLSLSAQPDGLVGGSLVTACGAVCPSRLGIIM